MAAIEVTTQVSVVEATDELIVIELGILGYLTAGEGLTGGGPTGQSITVALNAQSIASLELADTALQPGANVSELTNDAGYLVAADIESLQPSTGVLSIDLPVGATHNLAITDEVGFIDLTAAAGASNVTGITAGYDGQIVTITSRHAINNVTLNRLHSGSNANHRIRLSSDLTLFQDQGISIRYSTALTLWIPMS